MRDLVSDRESFATRACRCSYEDSGRPATNDAALPIHTEPLRFLDPVSANRGEEVQIVRRTFPPECEQSVDERSRPVADRLPRASCGGFRREKGLDARVVQELWPTVGTAGMLPHGLDASGECVIDEAPITYRFRALPSKLD